MTESVSLFQIGYSHGLYLTKAISKHLSQNLLSQAYHSLVGLSELIHYFQL